MKRMLLSFILGVGVGAGGYWYSQQEAGQAHLRQARDQVVTNAENLAANIKDRINGLSVDDIREEMNRSSTVVREKARGTGQSIASAASNARITAAVKTKLLAETGLNGFSINVDTTDGLVTLSGKVDSHDQIARVVKLALETEGVHKVVSTLQVTLEKEQASTK